MSPCARVIAIAIGLAACDGSTSAPPPPARASLAGAIANVGRHPIARESVARVAAAQHVTPIAARDALIRDALLASEAEARGLDRDPEVSARISAVLARALLHRVTKATREAPITGDEVRAITERHWLEIDRPEGFRVVHAVVRFSDRDAKEDRARAAVVAEKIRDEVVKIADRVPSLPAPARPSLFDKAPDTAKDPLAEVFREVASKIERGSFEVVIEELAPMAQDGRAVALTGQTFDAEFAKVASSLAARGDVSPVARTPFGAHVIMLLERTPAHRVPEEERRVMLRDEILAERARAADSALRAELRRGRVIAERADALLALVRVDPASDGPPRSRVPR